MDVSKIHFHVKKFSWKALLASGGLLVLHYLFTLVLPSAVADYVIKILKIIVGVD